MSVMDQGSRKGQRRLQIVKGPSHDQGYERGKIGLKFRSVLAQREERARRRVVVFVEKMVNEVRGKRD